MREQLTGDGLTHTMTGSGNDYGFIACIFCHSISVFSVAFFFKTEFLNSAKLVGFRLLDAVIFIQKCQKRIIALLFEILLYKNYFHLIG